MSKVTQGFENEIERDDTPLTQEEQRTALAINENDILKNMSGESAIHDHTETIEVKFGTTSYRFRIRPLSEKEWDKCRERNTRYSKNRRLGGMRLPESTNTTAYHSDLIYTATVAEDREMLWDNKKFWAAANIITGVDMVDKLIPYAGKKQAIIERIELLSGYDDDSEEEFDESVKN